MGKVHRVGDLSQHGGTVTQGAATVLVAGLPAARLGDLCPEPGHGPQAIVTGSARVMVEGRPLAREGDTLGCGATLSALQTSVTAG